MFDFVQEKRWLVQAVLGVIILTFAVWGVSSYRNSDQSAALAKVNGEKIGQQEFENAMEQQRQRIREMAGASFDPAMFDKPEVKHSVLDGLVSQHLLLGEARNVGLVVSDEQMAQIIASVPAFQKEGKFDKQQYEVALRGRSMTPAMFEYKVRQDLLTRQLVDAYTQNGYASDAVADALIKLNEQQRVVVVAKLGADAFANQSKVDEKAVKEYFEQHAQEFQIPERAKVEYVMLSIDSLMTQVSSTDDEIKQYYEEHLTEYGTQEQRQAAHILISLPKQASDAVKQEVKSKAEQVLKQVKASPAKFAELAKQYSQDPGSASNGGDLGAFGRGAMVKPFEDAVYSLQPGQISDLVQSEFGYHIIKLVAIKAAKTQPLSEVKAQISQRIKFQHANDKFAELAEKFNNAVYEQSDSLKAAAELSKSSVQGGVWLSKGQPASDPWNAKVMQAIFSDDVLKNKRNTAAIEVAPNTLLAARVTEYQPASVRALAEVSEGIKAKLVHTQALQAAIQQGKVVLGQLQHGEKVQVSWKPTQTISRAKHDDLSQDAAQLVFRANVNQLPAYVGVEDAQQGYMIVRIDAVKDAELADTGKRERYVQQIRQITGEEMLTAFMAESKKHADITMKEFASEDKK